MRIAVLHNLPSGGARRRLASQVAELDGEIREVCLTSSDPITASPIVISFEPAAPRVGPAWRPPLRYADLARLLLAWRRAAKAVQAAGADVVFANPCRYLQAPPGLLFLSIPSVYFCDEPRRVDYEAEARESINPTTRELYAPLRSFERRLDRAAVRRANLILTNSNYTAGGILQAYGRRATPIPLGVGHRFRPTEAQAGPASGYILSVGMLIPNKGHELVIEAAGCATDKRPVVIVAPRPDERHASRLRDVARAAGVPLDLRIGITDEDLRNLYSGAFATAYMARAEPLGLAAMEAQACGSPVVVSDEGGLPETIEAGVTGIAVPRRVDAVAAAFDALADPRRRGAMADAARKRGAELSWSRSAELVADSLRQVATGTSPVTR